MAATSSWAAPAGSATGAVAETQRAVFVGTFVARPQVDETGANPVRRYQVAVAEVFGPLDIATERVTVRSRLALEECGTREPGNQDGPGGTAGPGPRGEQPPGTPTGTPSSTPTSPSASPTQPAGTPIDRQPRVFDATLSGGEYVVSSCTDVFLAEDDVVARIERQFGAGRPPGVDKTPAPEPVTAVTYLCPDDRESLPENLDAAETSGSCDALGEEQGLDRAAAPGLALIIVGVLGLLLARRMGRRR